MEHIGIPVIIILCYMIGEIYKIIFKKKESLYKLIPILVSSIGGILGMIMYKTNKEMIPFANNIWVALEIGIMSGATSTGTNQILKQICKNKGDKKNE